MTLFMMALDAECCDADCPLCYVAFVLSVTSKLFMMSLVMLNVIMLNVMAPLTMHICSLPLALCVSFVGVWVCVGH
jgi:hypothetical protein